MELDTDHLPEQLLDVLADSFLSIVEHFIYREIDVQGSCHNDVEDEHLKGWVFRHCQQGLAAHTLPLACGGGRLLLPLHHPAGKVAELVFVKFVIKAVLIFNSNNV